LSDVNKGCCSAGFLFGLGGGTGGTFFDDFIVDVLLSSESRLVSNVDGSSISDSGLPALLETLTLSWCGGVVDTTV
jgi:hypothetical protein